MRTVRAPRLESDALVALCRSVYPVYREAPFIHLRLLARRLYDSRIHIYLYFWFWHGERRALRSLWRRKGPILAHDEEAIGHANLRRGEGNAFGEGVKHFGHIAHEAHQLRRAEEIFRHRLGNFSQYRRAILHDFF